MASEVDARMNELLSDHLREKRRAFELYAAFKPARPGPSK